MQFVGVIGHGLFLAPHIIAMATRKRSSAIQCADQVAVGMKPRLILCSPCARVRIMSGRGECNTRCLVVAASKCRLWYSSLQPNAGRTKHPTAQIDGAGDGCPAARAKTSMTRSPMVRPISRRNLDSAWPCRICDRRLKHRRRALPAIVLRWLHGRVPRAVRCPARSHDGVHV